MSRWFVSFSARSPQSPDDETWEIGISERKFRMLREKGHDVRLSRIILIEDTLNDTSIVYEGWSRPGKEDCYVYVGTPERDFRGPQIQVPAPPDMLFLVFVMASGEIDYWNWRRKSEDDPSQPEGVEGGTIIWPRVQD